MKKVQLLLADRLDLRQKDADLFVAEAGAVQLFQLTPDNLNYGGGVVQGKGEFLCRTAGVLTVRFPKRVCV